MKYADLATGSYSDQIGTILVLGQSIQLCDHLENIDGQYFATSFPLSADDRSILKQKGAQFGQMADDMPAIYLNEDLLALASPARSDDLETQAMLTRTMAAMQSMNVKAHGHANA